MTRRRILTLGRAVDRYIASLELIARRPRGIETYRDVLDRALDILGTDIDASQVERGEWLDVVATWKGLAPATIASRVSVLRSFAKWLFDEDITPTDTGAKLARPKKPRPHRPRPTTTDVDILLRVARNDRELIVVSILAMTGGRLSDLRGLRWGHVNGSTMHVVDGKGGKARAVPMPAPLVDILERVRATRSEHGLADDDHYIACAWAERVTPTGGRVDTPHPDRPCGVNTPQRILDRLADRAGIRHLSAHQLRRAYADRYLAAHPGDIVGLAAILGHEHISTTQGYLADARLTELQGRVETLHFVTPVSADIVTVGNRDSSPAAEVLDLQDFRGLMEAAGVEPASSETKPATSDGDEPSLGLVTPVSADLVTPDDGVGKDGR